MDPVPIDRLTSRVIVIDARHRVLLLASRMPDGAPDGRLWVAPGGALEADETWEQAARRELREETGLDVPIGPCVWHREHTVLGVASGIARSNTSSWLARR